MRDIKIDDWSLRGKICLTNKRRQTSLPDDKCKSQCSMGDHPCQTNLPSLDPEYMLAGLVIIQAVARDKLPVLRI